MTVTNSISHATRTSALDIARAVMHGLETGDFIPGERLVESEICIRFSVGRQIAREALQNLSARGIVHISPNRGASIARLSNEEAMQTLEITELLFGLASRSAARSIANGADRTRLEAAMAELKAAQGAREGHAFPSARSHFYAALAAASENAELSRLLEQVRVHVLRAQFGFSEEIQRHSGELLAIGEAVLAGEISRAEEMSRAHVAGIRTTLATRL